MRTSCRFAMAVHVLAVLAYQHGARVTSGFLADSVNTNPVIIRRLLLALRKARLIETRKGAGLGSCLSRSPGRINLAEVYRAVEAQRPFVMPRAKPNGSCPVGQGIAAALEQVFAHARTALEGDLARTTLAGIVKSVTGPRARCVREAHVPKLPALRALTVSLSQSQRGQSFPAGIH